MRALRREDLPTFDLPRKAISGTCSSTPGNSKLNLAGEMYLNVEDRKDRGGLLSVKRDFG